MIECTLGGTIGIPKSLGLDIADNPDHMVTTERKGAQPFPIYQESDSHYYFPLGSKFAWAVLAENGSEMIFPGHRGPTLTSTIELRENQKQAILDTEAAFEKSRTVLLNAACGTGKTIMALHLAAQIPGGSIVVLVDQTNIALQWQERINEFFPDATSEVYYSKGRNLDNIREDKVDFKIVLAQSLMRKTWFDNPIPAGLLIIDESHVFSAPRFVQALANVNFAQALSLSATIDRKDGLEWVFREFVGSALVKADAEVLTAIAVIPKVAVDVDLKHFTSAWCNRIKGMTWHDKCQGCDHVAAYPADCGGRLPYNPRTKTVRWVGDLMWTPLVQAVLRDERYRGMVLQLIGKFKTSTRQPLIFCQFKEPLINWYDWAVKEFGEDQCGLYIGGKADPEALKKRLTFTTYSMAQKALDVPWKDTALLGSPVSDVRQIVGRVVRLLDNKRQPLIIDPHCTNLRPLAGQAKKRTKHYEDMNMEIKWL